MHPSAHRCEPGDLDGFECPQRVAVVCAVCGRRWTPQLDSDGRVLGYTPSHLPPSRAFVGVRR